jgi:hypothetical protein
MGDSTYLCPGCNEPIEIRFVRQRRTLDNGGAIYHDRECQKAAGRETRTCCAPDCTNTVTRRKSGFNGDTVVCSAKCRGALTKTSQVYTCARPECGKEVSRKPSLVGEKVYCSPECRSDGQRAVSQMVPCAYDGVPFRCDARRAAKGKPVYCSVEHRKMGTHIELPCDTDGCPNKVTRYRSTLPKDRAPRVFCEDCCAGGAAFKPRKGTYKSCGCGCGEQIYCQPGESEDGQRYVDQEHKGRGQRGERVARVIRLCAVCDTPMRLTTDQSSHDVQTCSRECTAALRRRKPGERYVDKRTGYVVITTPDGRVMGEHRYVMEQEIGRALLPEETVHHKKGGFTGRSNNDLSNLELWSGSHPRGHRVEDIIAYSREKLALYCDGIERKRYAALASVG